MKSILDRSFKYTSSAETDVGRTFKRVRRRMEEEAETARLAEERARAEIASQHQVTPFNRDRKKGTA